MYDFRESYGRMSDDELLHVASQTSSLVPEAHDALNVELRKRQLSQFDVAQYEEAIARNEAERQRAKPLVRASFRGPGLRVYGKRDFGTDGSYLTTQWLVIGWIPLIPLASARVRRIGHDWPSWITGWNAQHEVLARVKPNVKQVLHVYTYLVGLFFLPYLLRNRPMRAAVAVCLLLPIPWVLRQYAKATSPSEDASVRSDERSPEE